MHIMYSMKRFLTILALLLPVAAFADGVSAGSARAVAEGFFGAGATKASDGVTLLFDSRSGRSITTAEEPSYYVFKRNSGGFVIVTGDDALPPVLAYSYNSPASAGNVPPELRYWLGKVDEAVEYARSHNVRPTAQTLRLWKAYRKNPSAAKAPQKVHETALWGQDNPYNNLAPTIGGDRCVTGCVATAMAIVARFNGYPESGTGTIPAYTTGKGLNIPANALGHSYNWSAMPLSDYNYTWTEESCNQVARLMYDCGTMIKMNYGVGASSAYSASIPGAFSKYFGYSKDAIEMDADGFSTSAWVTMLRAELESRPVIYSGSSSGGAHSFVLDGYDQDNYFRINFGWYGAYNGFFAFPEFNGGGYSFTEGQSAIFNLRPSNTGVAAEAVSLKPVGGLGLQASPMPTSTGASFSVTVGELNVHFNAEVSSVSVALAHVDASNNFKYLVSNEKKFTLEPGHYYPAGSITFYNCYLMEAPDAGDKIILVYQHSRSDGWQPCIYPQDQKDLCEIRLTSSAGLAESTSLVYDKKAGLLTLNTLPGASCQVVAEDGSTVGAASYDAAAGRLILDESTVKGGRYTVKLALGTQSCSFVVILKRKN